MILGTACMVPLVLVLFALTTPAQNFLWGRKLAASAGNANPYRGRQDLRASDLSEPWTVRLGATLSALLGGMIVPGGLAALAALIPLLSVGDKLLSGREVNAGEFAVFLVALSAPSGLAIAFRSLRVFGPMLKNEEGITKRMRGLAWHSGIHNVLLLLLYIWTWFQISEGDRSALMVAGYNVISLIHVAFLFISARSIDRRRKQNAEYEAAAARVGGTASPEERFIEPSMVGLEAAEAEALAAEEAARPFAKQVFR
jgi:hypothetical protein